MRVTKIIREYVEKTVTSRLPYGGRCAPWKTVTIKQNRHGEGKFQDFVMGKGNRQK